MKIARRAFAPMIFLVVATMAFGCGDDDSGSEPTPTNNPDNNTEGGPQGVRVFYAPSTPATVSVVFKSDADEIELAPIPSYTATDYKALPPAVYRAIFFDASGAPTGVTVESIPVEASSVATLLVSEGESGNVRKQIISDVAPAPSENHARLRFLYEATGPGVDVYSMADGLRIGTSMQLGEQIPHTEYAAGSYTFEVRLEGLSDVALSIADVPLPPGQVVTVFLYGNPDPNEDSDPSDSTLAYAVAVDVQY